MGKKKKVPLYATYKEVFVGLNTTYSSGGEATDPSDRYSDRSDEYLNMECSDDFVLKENRGDYSESVLVPDWVDGTEVLYGIVITYSSGDTFGHSSGHKHIPIAFVSVEKANELAKEVNDKEHWDRDKYGYECWSGFFESLEGVEVKKFIFSEVPLFKSGV